MKIMTASRSVEGYSLIALFILCYLTAHALRATPVSHTRTLHNVDYTVAGISGVSGGSGTITVTGVQGVVTQALLYWHGINNSASDAVYDNPIVTINENSATGTSLGDAPTNCWGPGSSRAFEADVTAFVTGDGTYTIAGLSSCSGCSANGASLVVVFNDGNPLNDRDLAFFTGNDSNVPASFPGEDTGWHAVLTPISYNGGQVKSIFHAADGQDFSDNSITFTTGGTPLTVADDSTLWDGNSVPSAGTSRASNGNLWDIHTFDITAAFGAPGPKTLQLDGQDPSADCLGLILLLLDLEPNSAPNPTPSPTPTPTPGPSPICYNGHTYLLTSIAETWTDAEAEAVSMGGHLAAVDDAAEQAFLVSTFLTGDFALQPLWIGFTDRAREGRFVWSNGQRVSYTYWNAATFEPNDCCTKTTHEEDYVTLNWHHARNSSAPIGTWNDVPNTGTTLVGNAHGPYFGIIELAQPACAAEGTVQVSVSASPTQVNEGQDANFIISVSTPHPDIVVSYSMSDKAQLGLDYTLSGTPDEVAVPANQSSATVTLQALTDEAKEKPEKATMTLQSGSGYTVVDPNNATISIFDSR